MNADGNVNLNVSSFLASRKFSHLQAMGGGEGFLQSCLCVANRCLGNFFIPNVCGDENGEDDYLKVRTLTL